MTYIFYGLATALVLFAAYLMIKDQTYKERWAWVFAPVLTVFAVGVLYAAMMLVSTVAAYITAPERTVVTNIYSMGDGMGVEGRGGLFGSFGTIDNQPVFMYYVKDVNGYFQLRHMNADRVKITQTDDVTPHFERECNILDEAPSWTDMPMLGFEDVPLDCGVDSDVYFFVPEGSIKQQYNLDAQ